MKHGCLLVQRSQIGSSGNVASHSTSKTINTKSHSILSNWSSKNRNLIGTCLRCLQSRRCVGKNQIHIRRDKAVNNGRTGVRIPLCVLLVKLYLIPQSFGQRIFKSQSSGIQRVMLHQLTDSHSVGFFCSGVIFLVFAFFVLCSICTCRGVWLFLCCASSLCGSRPVSPARTGSERQHHGSSQRHG